MKVVLAHLWQLVSTNKSIIKEYNSRYKDFVNYINKFKEDLLHGFTCPKEEVINLKDGIIYKLSQELKLCETNSIT